MFCMSKLHISSNVTVTDLPVLSTINIVLRYMDLFLFVCFYFKCLYQFNYKYAYYNTHKCLSQNIYMFIAIHRCLLQLTNVFYNL